MISGLESSLQKQTSACHDSAALFLQLPSVHNLLQSRKLCENVLVTFSFTLIVCAYAKLLCVEQTSPQVNFNLRDSGPPPVVVPPAPPFQSISLRLHASASLVNFQTQPLAIDHTKSLQKPAFTAAPNLSKCKMLRCRGKPAGIQMGQESWPQLHHMIPESWLVFSF